MSRWPSTVATNDSPDGPSCTSAPARRRPHPHWIAAKGFGLVILIGAALLMLPCAGAGDRRISPLAALFTATSATCVTGLTVLDTGSDFSLFGQIVILTLIQIGGLGIMTLGTFLLVLSGHRLTLKDELVIMDALGYRRVRGLQSLLARAVLFTVVLEAAGAVLLSWRFYSAHGFSLSRALYEGAFHSVSAFCNAGFSLHATSLMDFRTDKLVIFVVASLIVLGGLGFLVLYNLASIRFWRRDRLRRGRLTLHARVVLRASAALVVLGFVGFFLLERNRSLDGLSWDNQLVCSLFQSLTPRTAGFNVVEMTRIAPLTHFMTMLLMFIGGSPASTAGGIKTTTLVVLIATAAAMIRGRRETELYSRTVPPRVVREALSIFLLGLACVGISTAVLLCTENMGPPSPGLSTSDALVFETVSAFATVGLSTGITPALSAPGKLCLILCMFIGRLGPLTIALVVSRRDTSQAIRYAEEEVVVG